MCLTAPFQRLCGTFAGRRILPKRASLVRATRRLIVSRDTAASSFRNTRSKARSVRRRDRAGTRTTRRRPFLPRSIRRRRARFPAPRPFVLRFRNRWYFPVCVRLFLALFSSEIRAFRLVVRRLATRRQASAFRTSFALPRVCVCALRRSLDPLRVGLPKFLSDG